MKLKFIVNNLIVAAMIAGVSCSVTSCKDTDSDLYSQLKEDNANLQKQIDQINAKLSTCKDDCKATILAEVEKMLANYQVKGDYVTNDKLNAAIANFITAADATTQINSALSNYLTKAEVLELISKIQPGLSAAEVSQTVNDALKNYTTEGQVNALIDAAIADLKPSTSGMTEDEIKALIDYAISKIELPQGGLTQAEVQQLIDYALSKLPEAPSVDVDAIKAAVNEVLAPYNQEMQNIVAQVTAISNTLTELLGKNYVTQETLNNLISNYVKTADLQTILADYLLKTDLNGYLKTDELAAEIDKLIKANSDEYTTLKEALDALKTAGTYESRIADLEKKIKDCLTDEDINDALFEAKFDEINDQLTNLRADVNSLSDKIDALTGRLNNLITSIICQSVFNPVYGTMALPIDLRSNILMCYYGEGDNTVVFPTDDTLVAYNGNEGYVLTDNDLILLEKYCGVTYETYPAKTQYGDGKLGTIYLTVNPVNVDFSGSPLKLVQSDGKESPVKLGNAKVSTDLITFGYNRAGNGFYESHASVDPAQLGKIKVNIEEGLKSAVRDALKNRTANDVAYLGKVLYNQFDGILPALALRAEWQDGDKTNAIISQYGIAATAFRPLSYSFLYDKSFRTLPNVPDWGKFQIDLNMPTMTWTVPSFDIDVEGLKQTIEFKDVKYTITEGDKLYVTIAQWPVFDSEGKVIAYTSKDFTVENVQKFIDAFEVELNSSMNAMVDDVKDKFITKLVSEMEREVNKMMQSIESQVQDNFEDVVKDLEQQVNDKISNYTGKLEKYTKRIQTAINRINNLLDHPNYYMQPCLFYGVDGSNYSRMSTSKAFPTQLKLNGGNTINIYPSTFNAEVITPAYKKFVAVTNVYTSSKSAANGDAACVKALQTANQKGSYLCEVVPGKRLTMGLQLTKVGGEATTFEIVYQALDYHGKISTVKCYVTVK